MEFSDNYTQIVSDFYWRYNSNYLTNCAQIKEDIENIPENITKEELLKKIRKIRDEYRCSSRRFLVEYMRGLATETFADESFDVDYKGKKYHFSGAGMEKIQMMETEERMQYIVLLIEISMDNSGDSKADKKCLKQWELLYRKAMLFDAEVPILNRMDVLQIAHGLKFTFDMAEEYLIRAMDNDCFDYNKSDDLIEMFCFIHPEANNYHVAEELKQRYIRETEKIEQEKLDNKPQNFTALIESDFPVLIQEWERNVTVPAEEKLIEWLLTKASFLNMTSQTARKIYTSLVYLAYQIIDNEKILDNYEGEAVSDIVMDFCMNKEVPDDIDEYKLRAVILKCAAYSFDNKRVKNKKQFGTIWRYITLSDKGEIKTQAVGDAISELISGNQSVTKADILFMIWFVCELLWSFTQEETDLYEQLSDFWTLSEDLLEECRLPAFYAPHLLEQSMLMSICLGNEEESPFEVYETLCEELNPIKKRVRTSCKETESDAATTKQKRKLREAEIREEFKRGQIIWDGTEKLLFQHLCSHGQEKGQYIFEKDGISYYPNPTVVVSYVGADVAVKFDLNQSGYNDEEHLDDRLSYLYSIYLYLRRECKKNGIKLKCRINYRKNCMIQILEYIYK